MGREPITLPSLEDDSPMPTGKYKDTIMSQVPNKYLLYIYENNMATNARVRKYIESNLEVIKTLAKREKEE